MKACILDYQSLCPEDLNMQDLWGQKVSGESIEWCLHESTPAALTAQRIQGQHIILSNKVVIDAEMLADNPQLRCIIILATGTNNVDLNAAKALNIPVCNIVGYSTESVVQQTFAMMLALKSQLIPFTQTVTQGDWCKSQFFGLHSHQINEISGTTLGIIGYGSIGKRVKIVAEAFGMNVLVAESLSGVSSSGRTPLDSLYQCADVISIHSPLTPESNNLVTQASFRKMKPSAILLNMGRGGIVNEQDLAAALKNHTISGAATDVLSQEPPSPEHILLDETIPNLLIMPHTAWASRQARQQLLDQVVEILQSLATSSIKNCVNLN